MKPYETEAEFQRLLDERIEVRGPARTLKIQTPFGSLFLAVEVIDGKPEFVITSPQKIEDTTIRKLLDKLADGFTRLLRSST